MEDVTGYLTVMDGNDLSTVQIKYAVDSDELRLSVDEPSIPLCVRQRFEDLYHQCMFSYESRKHTATDTLLSIKLAPSRVKFWLKSFEEMPETWSMHVSDWRTLWQWAEFVPNRGPREDVFYPC